MKSNPNIIGRYCMVKDLKTSPPSIVEAIVIDKVAGTNNSKRVRLQTGEHFGEVRMAGEYEMMEFVSPGEAPPVIAEAWQG